MWGKHGGTGRGGGGAAEGVGLRERGRGDEAEATPPLCPAHFLPSPPATPPAHQWGLKAMREGRGFAWPRPLPLALPPSLWGLGGPKGRGEVMNNI